MTLPAVIEEPVDSGSEHVNTALAVQQSRESKAVEARVLVAQRMGRNEERCRLDINRACEHFRLAECATYAYPRGNKVVTGPSIRLVEAIAARWGWLEYGWVEVDRQVGQSRIEVFAWDVATGARSQREFIVRHVRESTDRQTKTTISTPLDNERDIYETCANMAARRVRECIRSLIPSDVVDEAWEICQKTLAAGDRKSLPDRIRQCLDAFTELGVTVEAIENRLQHAATGITAAELGELRAIFNSIKQTPESRDDFFPRQAPSRAKREIAAGKKGPQPAQEPDLTVEASRASLKASGGELPPDDLLDF